MTPELKQRREKGTEKREPGIVVVKGGKTAVPNLSLLSKVVLLIALRYIVRELFAHICLPCP